MNDLDNYCLLTLLNLELSEIFRICNGSPSLTELIYSNEEFWKRKFFLDFPTQAQSPRFQDLPLKYPNWRELFRHFSNIIPYCFYFLSQFNKLIENCPKEVVNLLITDYNSPERFCQLTYSSQGLKLIGQFDDLQTHFKKCCLRQELLGRTTPFIDFINRLDVHKIILECNSQVIEEMAF